MAAAVFEVDARAHDEILDGARDDDLSRLGKRGNASADVDGDAAHVLADQLALTGVYSGAQNETEPIHVVDGCACAPDGSGRSIERCEETVAGLLYLASAKALKRGSHCGVVRLEQLSPALVAEPCCLLGRSHDVSEQDGRQDAIGLDNRLIPDQELLDQIENRTRVSE